MRLWVRPDARLNLSPGFSRAGGGAPDRPRVELLYRAARPISGRADSRARGARQGEKRTLPGAPAGVSGLAGVAASAPRPGRGPRRRVRLPVREY